MAALFVGREAIQVLKDSKKPNQESKEMVKDQSKSKQVKFQNMVYTGLEIGA